jgi:HK97 family phage prohead protease
MHRAYATLEIRATGERNGKRVFSGMASTPTPDSYQDIVEPMGAEFATPMPLLWQHDSGDPIGWMHFAKPTSKGIPFEAEVADIPDDGKAGTQELIKRLDKAWAYLKNKLVRGVSIGFQPIESSRIENTGGYRFTKWKWLELSAVTIPANADASITAIKSADAALRASSGRGSVTLTRATAPLGNPPSAPLGSQSKGTAVKTLQQLIEERATKSARATELHELKTKEARQYSEAERAEQRELDAELTALEDQIIDARMVERQAASATRVNKAASSGPTILVKRTDPEDKFKGQSFVRMLKMKALARITGESVAQLAQHHFGQTHPNFVQVTRAAVAGGGTGSGEWGAELARLDATYTGDFIEFLHGATVFDRLPLREVPARVRVKGQDGAATGYWVGESKAIPASAQDYSNVDLTPLKVAALAVVSNELIEDSAPAADRLVRDAIVEASSQRVDQTFLSSTAASAGVSPAGLLNGLSAGAPSGTDEAAVRADMQALAYPFVTNKMASGLVFVMNPAQGLALGSFINTFSQPAFPGINENGGTFLGRTVYTGDNVTPGDIILMRPQDIWKIGDSGIQVSMSDMATIEQNDAPAGASDTPVAMASHFVSMFQSESTAFKVVRRINFQKRRSTAVTVLSNAEYGGVTS